MLTGGEATMDAALRAARTDVRRIATGGTRELPPADVAQDTEKVDRAEARRLLGGSGLATGQVASLVGGKPVDGTTARAMDVYQGAFADPVFLAAFVREAFKHLG